MIIDHIGLYFFPETWILRAVGRYAFPIFCFFAGFNFKNSLRFKTLIYGIALYLFTTAVIFEQIIEANILISIFVGYVYLIIFQSLPPYPELNQANEFKSEAAQRTSVREYSRVLKNSFVSFNSGYGINNFWKAYTHFLVLACFCPLTSKFLEYGTLGIAVMVLGYSVKNNLISLPIAAFTTAYTSLSYAMIIYFDYFKTPEFIVTTIATVAIYFSLTFKSFHQVNNLKLTIISNNLLAIYCLHLVIIMIVWRYSIIGSFLA